MLFGDHLVVVRGGGDLATGAVARLHRAGFPVVVLELEEPLAIRRTVAVAAAVTEKAVQVEDLEAARVGTPAEAVALAATGTIPVLVASTLPAFTREPSVLVDGRVAKRNLDTSIDQAPLVVALGPGFTAGVDCDAVVETMRGHHLGRVIWEGAAAPNTGTPGVLGGKGAERVIRAAVSGELVWQVGIAELVEEGQVMGSIDGVPVPAPLGGVVRGLLADRRPVEAGLKIADIDPRGDPSVCFEISDKAQSVGGGVVEAVLVWLGRS